MMVSEGGSYQHNDFVEVFAYGPLNMKTNV
jgi:hypothetical protein